MEDLAIKADSLDIAIRKLERLIPLRHEEKEALRAAFPRVKELGLGEDVLRRGGPSTHCGVVLSGFLARYEAFPDGGRQIVSVALPGDFFDLQSCAFGVMDQGVGALTSAKVATAPHETVAALARAHPRIAALLHREAAIENAVLRQWVVNCGRRTAYARIAHLFCELYLRLAAVGQGQQHACQLPFTQATLSDATGLSVVHVNRVLQQLRGDGFITLKAGRLVIHDWNGLAGIAGFDPAYLHQGHRQPEAGMDHAVPWPALTALRAS